MESTNRGHWPGFASASSTPDLVTPSISFLPIDRNVFNIGVNRSVIDGPFAETKELVAGYWILQCKSLAETIEWIKRCPNPHNEDCEIEIRQLFELDDFGTSQAVEHHRRLGDRLPRSASALVVVIRGCLV